MDEIIQTPKEEWSTKMLEIDSISDRMSHSMYDCSFKPLRDSSSQMSSGAKASAEYLPEIKHKNKNEQNL